MVESRQSIVTGSFRFNPIAVAFARGLYGTILDDPAVFVGFGVHVDRIAVRKVLRVIPQRMPLTIRGVKIARGWQSLSLPKGARFALRGQGIFPTEVHEEASPEQRRPNANPTANRSQSTCYRPRSSSSKQETAN